MMSLPLLLLLLLLVLVRLLLVLIRTTYPAALPVPGAHHLLVDADSDTGRGVPLLAHSAAHRHHLRRLQHLGQGGGVSSYRGAPAAVAPWAW